LSEPAHEVPSRAVAALTFVAVGAVAGIAAGMVAGSPAAFWFDLTLAVAVPLALVVGMVAATYWLARAYERPTRFQFTIRRLMVAVAIGGVMLGLVTWMGRRAAAFRLTSALHHQAWVDLAPVPSPVYPGRLRPRRWTPARRAYHWSMADKYRFAARSPWLSVAPDPPEPE
jgi:hypothetical protein